VNHPCPACNPPGADGLQALTAAFAGQNLEPSPTGQQMYRFGRFCKEARTWDIYRHQPPTPIKYFDASGNFLLVTQRGSHSVSYGSGQCTCAVTAPHYGTVRVVGAGGALAALVEGINAPADVISRAQCCGCLGYTANVVGGISCHTTYAKGIDPLIATLMATEYVRICYDEDMDHKFSEAAY